MLGTFELLWVNYLRQNNVKKNRCSVFLRKMIFFFLFNEKSNFLNCEISLNVSSINTHHKAWKLIKFPWIGPESLYVLQGKALKALSWHGFVKESVEKFNLNVETCEPVCMYICITTSTLKRSANKMKTWMQFELIFIILVKWESRMLLTRAKVVYSFISYLLICTHISLPYQSI